MPFICALFNDAASSSHYRVNNEVVRICKEAFVLYSEVLPDICLNGQPASPPRFERRISSSCFITDAPSYETGLEHTDWPPPSFSCYQRTRLDYLPANLAKTCRNNRDTLKANFPAPTPPFHPHACALCSSELHHKICPSQEVHSPTRKLITSYPMPHESSKCRVALVIYN